MLWTSTPSAGAYQHFPMSGRHYLRMLCLCLLALCLTPFTAQAQSTPPIPLEGELAYGASTWQATARFDSFVHKPGERITAQIDATLTLDDADRYAYGGRLYLVPVADADGAPIAPPDAFWTSHRTPGGLPLVGVYQPVTFLAESRAVSPRPLADGTGVRLRLLFSAPIPPDLPAGWYQWRFTGHASIGDSTPFDWYDNRIFDTTGQGRVGTSAIDLSPLIRIAQPQTPRLLTTILDGILPDAPPTFLSPDIYELTPRILAPISTSHLSEGVSAMLTNPNGIQTRLHDLSQPVELDIYGDYTLTLTGEITDDFGTPVTLDNTYYLSIAQPLALEPAILPGTPFVVGDAIAPNLRLTPSLGIPYEVRVTLTQIPFDGRPPIHNEITGMTNRYGFFDISPIVAGVVGEYELTYHAHATHEGRRYATSQTSTGVIVAPDSPPTNGQRGIVGQDSTIAQTWYDTATYPDDAPDLLPHLYAPFFSGDVLYLPDADAFAIQPALTRGGARPTYAHVAIAQPTVTWRHAITQAPLPRLTPTETSAQIGSGVQGLRPADYAFLLGGILSPDGVQGYASGMVITSDASARVLPPFTRPLLTVDNRARNMLFYASSLMAGSVLSEQTPLTLTGYLLPTVSARVDITLTTPSGRTLRQSEQTNAFGYLYAQLPMADESGVWQITLDIKAEGNTSAGELIAPVRERLSWEFYVLPDATDALTSTLPTVRVLSPTQTLNLNFAPPEDWRDISARYTLRTPSYHLISTDAPRVGANLSVTFNRSEWARRYPNIETGSGAGMSASDAVHITLYAQGTNAEGEVRHAVRTVTIWHDALYTFEDD